jgi:hypothetical protein
VVQIPNVVKSMDKQYALASLDILVLPLLADLNVSQALNVLKMRLAITKNVSIHVLEHVELTQNVKSGIIIQYVHAHKGTQVTLS